MVGLRHRCIPKSDGVQSAHQSRVSRDVRETKRPEMDAGVAPGPSDTKREFRKPLAKDADKTLTATKPWKAEGISRASWYRRQKERK